MFVFFIIVLSDVCLFKVEYLFHKIYILTCLYVINYVFTSN